MTITADIIPTIKSINIVLPMLYAALSRSEPIPKTEYVLLPNTKYSATIREFHPPPQPVILPVINEGYIDGSKIRLTYWTLVTLNARAVSSISLDIERTPPIKLNNIYHCIPDNISRIVRNSNPPGT